MTLPRLHTPADVAAAWGRSADWWERRARRGEVPFTRIGRSIRFTDTQIARILAKFEQEPTVPTTPASTPDAAAPPVPAEDRTGLSPRSRARAKARARGDA